MVVRVFISGISGNKEVKKRQQRVTMILDSKNIDYVVVDIGEPGRENEKEFMQENSNPKDSKHSLPPQIFNDNHYCGDYEDFDMANEVDELEKFLNLISSQTGENGVVNGLNTEPCGQDLLKKDVRESTQGAVDTVSRTEPEAMSIGNGIETNDPDEIPKTFGNIPKNINARSENLDEFPVEDLNNNSRNEVFVEIPKKDTDEILEETAKQESLNKGNIDVDMKNEESPIDCTDNKD